MSSKSPTTWIQTLLFVGGLVVVGPLCYLLWFGATGLITGGFSKDAWLQAAANLIGSMISGSLAVAAVAYVFVAERELDRMKASEELATLRRATLREFSEQMPETLSNIQTILSEFDVTSPIDATKDIVSFFDAKLIKRPDLSAVTRNEFERRLYKEYAEYEAFTDRFGLFENAARKAVELTTQNGTDPRDAFKITWRMVVLARQIAAIARNIFFFMDDKAHAATIENCNSIIRVCIPLENALKAKVFLPRLG